MYLRRDGAPAHLLWCRRYAWFHAYMLRAFRIYRPFSALCGNEQSRCSVCTVALHYIYMSCILTRAPSLSPPCGTAVHLVSLLDACPQYARDVYCATDPWIELHTNWGNLVACSTLGENNAPRNLHDQILQEVPFSVPICWMLAPYPSCSKCKDFLIGLYVSFFSLVFTDFAFFSLYLRYHFEPSKWDPRDSVNSGKMQMSASDFIRHDRNVMFSVNFWTIWH